jgi:uroporphyrinogen-III synthase
MPKNEEKQSSAAKVVKNILISQPKPESDKSPYYELEKKHRVNLFFHPFIKLEGIGAKEFRKQKIDIAHFTAVIFTSRNAIDHFFRMADELKVTIHPDTKYFCITESVALYLQKFILYRKRKVFYGSDGTNKSLFDAINRHKGNERFLYVCSENQQDNEIVNWLKGHQCEYQLAFMYRTISNDIKTVLESHHFYVICFFTPSGVKSLFENIPDFRQNGTVIGAFGNNTSRAIQERGLELHIQGPAPQKPSMVAALDEYLKQVSAKKK